MPRRPPRPSLFPYTTLFRSQGLVARAVVLKYTPTLKFLMDDSVVRGNRVLQIIEELEKMTPSEPDQDRSEEHTSELQSPDHLVCRLLLEKKKRERQNLLRRA